MNKNQTEIQKLNHLESIINSLDLTPLQESAAIDKKLNAAAARVESSAAYLDHLARTEALRQLQEAKNYVGKLKAAVEKTGLEIHLQAGNSIKGSLNNNILFTFGNLSIGSLIEIETDSKSLPAVSSAGVDIIQQKTITSTEKYIVKSFTPDVAGNHATIQKTNATAVIRRSDAKLTPYSPKTAVYFDQDTKRVMIPATYAPASADYIITIAGKDYRPAAKFAASSVPEYELEEIEG